MRTLALATLLACALADPSDGSDASDTEPSDTLTTTDTYVPPPSTTTIDPGALHGDVPAVPLPPPTFAVVNRDGSARTQVDLVGHPTVMWFYPAANTGG